MVICGFSIRWFAVTNSPSYIVLHTQKGDFAHGIMQLFNTLFRAALGGILLLPSSNALIEIRYLFNNGVDDPSMTCNEQDMYIMDEIFSLRVNRNLRGKEVAIEHRAIDFITDMTGSKQHPERQLAYPLYCKDSCRGFAPRTCRAVNCVGYRRKMVEEMQCANTTALINADLAYYSSTNQLSSSCQSLVNAPRTIECYDDVVYGEITSFTAWKGQATNVVLQTNVADGYQVCKSDNVNFQVVANNCVTYVEMEVIRSNGHEKYFEDATAPFSLVPNQGDVWFGANITVGSYTLVANPNSFTEKAKQVTFSVLNC